MATISRTLFSLIIEKLIPGKAILVYGARRVGKTILLHQVIDSFKGNTLLLNGEDYDTLTLLGEKSIANYRRLLDSIDLLVIDEAQNIPDIGEKIKLIVDEIPSVRVLASGSSSFDLLNKTGEPLVGRSFQFRLAPFSQKELSAHETLLQTRQNLDDRLIFGSYPDVVLMRSSADKIDYLRSITDSYLLKDILTLDGVKNSSKMFDILRLVAFQLGNEVSYEELGRQVGLSKNTVEKYMDLLSKVFVIYRVGAFSRNLRKEVRKTCKWYFYDCGIRNAIINNFKSPAIRDDMGHLWENYLITERLKSCLYAHDLRNFYFWRTYDNQEIDLIEDAGNETIHAFEFKWGDNLPSAPKAFASAYPNSDFEVVNRTNYLDFIL